MHSPDRPDVDRQRRGSERDQQRAGGENGEEGEGGREGIVIAW